MDTLFNTPIISEAEIEELEYDVYCEEAYEAHLWYMENMHEPDYIPDTDPF